MPKPNLLVDLFHHRWTVPLLAELHRTAGAKMVSLVNRLAVSRGALRQAIDASIVHGWVMRNPGYGHPLRPEYILSDAGAKIAPACLELVDVLHRRRLEGVMLRKWSAVALHAVGQSRRRFTELTSAMPGISDRALALALKQLCSAGLLKRRVRDTYPPAAEYGLAPNARRLVENLNHLCT